MNSSAAENFCPCILVNIYVNFYRKISEVKLLSPRVYICSIVVDTNKLYFKVVVEIHTIIIIIV